MRSPTSVDCSGSTETNDAFDCCTHGAMHEPIFTGAYFELGFSFFACGVGFAGGGGGRTSIAGLRGLTKSHFTRMLQQKSKATSVAR